MSAGLNVFLTIMIVLSDTEAVRGGVMSDTGRVGVISGERVAILVIWAVAGCTGGDSEHPQARIKRETKKRRAGMFLIDAGRSFPYNKMVVIPVAQTSLPGITVTAGPAQGGGCRRLLMT
jgi:hypothetical protein